MPAWLRTLIRRVKCSQMAGTCTYCHEWKSAKQAKNAAKVERLTRPK